MLAYEGTLTSARAFAGEGRLEEWIHQYLNHEGRNPAFSDGLKLTERYFLGPAEFPRDLFTRCAGPEPGMKYPIDPAGWERKVASLQESISSGADLPPLMVNYAEGRFELNDGNHRHKAYENLGISTVWAILWITEKKDLDRFLEEYGEYVENCKIVRR